MKIKQKLGFILASLMLITLFAPMITPTKAGAAGPTAEVRNFQEFKAALLDNGVTAIDIKNSFSFTDNIQNVPNRNFTINGNADKGVIINSAEYSIFGNQNTSGKNTLSIINAKITGRGTPKQDDYTDGRFFTGGSGNGPTSLGWDVYAKDVHYVGARFVHLSNGTLTFDGNNEIYTNCENAWVNHVVFKANSTYKSSNSGTGDYGAFYFNKGKGYADGTAIIEPNAKTYFNIGTAVQPVFTGDVYKTVIGEGAVFDVNTIGHAIWYVAGNASYYSVGNPEFTASKNAVVDLKQVSAAQVLNAKAFKLNPNPDLYVPVYFAKSGSPEVGGNLFVEEGATFLVSGKTNNHSSYGVIRMGAQSAIHLNKPLLYDIKNNAVKSPAISTNAALHTLDLNLTGTVVSTWLMLNTAGETYNQTPYQTFNDVTGKAVLEGTKSKSVATTNTDMNNTFKTEQYGRIAIKGGAGNGGGSADYVTITILHEEDNGTILYQEKMTAQKNSSVTARWIKFAGYELKQGQQFEQKVVADRDKTIKFIYIKEGTNLQNHLATVLVNHVDADNYNTVFAVETYNVQIGSAFTPTAIDVSTHGYSLDALPGTLTIASGSNEVYVTYKKNTTGTNINPNNNRFITVNHKLQNTNGPLIASLREVAKPGSSYTANALSTSGYILKPGQTLPLTISPVLDQDYVLEIYYEKDPPVQLDKQRHDNYVNGYVDGTFKPNNPITRAEAAMIFYNLMVDSNKENYNSNFGDVPIGSWYYKAISALSKNGIVFGYRDGKFYPNRYITRAEFATIASRFDKLETVSASMFTDVPVHHWAYSYINSAAKKGWITGYANGQFKPNNNIIRAEVVVLVNRVLERKVRPQDIPAWAKKFPDILTHWAYADIMEAANKHDYTKDENGFETWKQLIE